MNPTLPARLGQLVKATKMVVWEHPLWLSGWVFGLGIPYAGIGFPVIQLCRSAGQHLDVPAFVRLLVISYLCSLLAVILARALSVITNPPRVRLRLPCQEAPSC